MANKQNFKPDEWTKILESTMLAGMAVSAAEPSGLWGALKEAFASSSALAAAKSDAGSNELVKAVVADFETKEGRSAVKEALRQHLVGAKPADAVQRSLANLREVSNYPQCQGSPGRGGVQGLVTGHQQKRGRGLFRGRFPGHRRRTSQRR